MSLNNHVVSEKLNKEKVKTVKQLGNWEYQEDRLCEVLELPKRRFLQFELGYYVPQNQLVFCEKINSVNPELLCKAIDALVARHESLRTTFTYTNQKVMQKIHRKDEFKTNLVYEDISNNSNKEEKLKELIYQVYDYSFDFEDEQAFRCYLFKCNRDEYEFFFIIDHIISDLQSIKVLREDLLALYEAYDNNVSNPLPKLKVRLRDFIFSCNENYEGVLLKKHQLYYDDIFRGLTSGLKVLAKYSGHKNKALANTIVPSEEIKKLNALRNLKKFNLTKKEFFALTKNNNGGSYVFPISDDILKSNQHLSSELKVSLYTVFLSVFGIFLNSITSQKGVLVDTPMSMRSEGDSLKLVGWLTGAIVTRFDKDTDWNLSDTILNTKNKIIEATDHSRFQPSPELVDVIHAQLNFNYENSTFQFEDNPPVHMDKEVGMDFTFDVRVFRNGMQIFCTYNKEVIKKSKISALCTKFVEMLRIAGQSKNGAIKVANLIK